jgi:hypothetical protein
VPLCAVDNVSVDVMRNKQNVVIKTRRKENTDAVMMMMMMGS